MEITNLMTGSPLYALYGSLRAGMGNHRRFADGMEYLETIRIPGFRMYALRYYPYVIVSDDPSDSVVAEIVRLKDPEMEQSMVEFEASVGYELHRFSVKGAETRIFIFKSAGAHPPVPGGDWVEFKRGLQA